MIKVNHLQDKVDRAVAAAQLELGRGRVASYIPALSDVEPNQIGLSVMTLAGQTVQAGDANKQFSIQSISKVFTLALALEKVGDSLWDRVGREPSGSKFNSIVQLESEIGRPRNPLINAGAIVTTDAFMTDDVEQSIGLIENFIQTLADDFSVNVNLEIAQSEDEAGARNRSLAYFMSSFGNVTHPVEKLLKVYFHQCALSMSCSQLARAGLFLANAGVDPLTERRIVSEKICQQINSLMMMCGHYDNSGDFAFRVGLPGKSGVGGGVLTIAPGRGVIVAWSPALNDAGTSFAGSTAIEHFVRELNWSIF